MASIIRIKRSGVAGNPSTLAAGELAYSSLTDNGSNGGDRLYIGVGTETNGNAATHVVIGGKFFTDLLDHSAGTLTASSAIVVDSSSKINNLKVDNIDIDGNTISSTNNNGNIEITPNGTGSIVLDGQSWPQSDGTSNYYLKTNGAGQLSWAAIPSGSFTIAADSGTADAFSTGETLTFEGTDPIDTLVSDNKITISAKDASTSVKGVASFNSDDFSASSGAISLADTVVKSITTDSGALTPASHGISIIGGEGIDVTHSTTTITVAGEDATTSNKGIASFSSASFGVASGEVTIKSGGVSNSQLANSSITVGSTSISLGNTSTTLAGLTELTVDNININGNDITSINVNGDIVLNPNGTGSVDVSGARITGVGAPSAATDAATKGYVDSVAEGLHVHASVAAATTDTLSALTSNGTVTYNNGTNGVGATLTLQNSLSTLDNYTLQNNDRILVKDQANKAHNGIYTWVTGGTVLTRVTDFDTNTEIQGGDFVFVVNGSQYNSTGWVQSDPVATVGSSNIDFIQFSGAGTYIGGDGLTLSGSTFSVNVAATGGIEISADALQLKSTVAGNGLTLTSGVLAVGGTPDRITVTADAIDIASTYAGQSTIVTLGTVTTGTWSATAIGATKGGTGLTSYTTGDLIYASATDTLAKRAIGTEGQVLQVNSSGVPVWGDVDGGTY